MAWVLASESRCLSIAGPNLVAYGAALGSAGLVNRVVAAGMIIPLGSSRCSKAELVARALGDYRNLLDGGGCSPRLAGVLGNVLDQAKTAAADTLTEHHARLVGSLEAELLFERRAGLVSHLKFMKSEGASREQLLAEIARWQEEAELLKNPLYRGGVVETPPISVTTTKPAGEPELAWAFAQHWNHPDEATHGMFRHFVIGDTDLRDHNHLVGGIHRLSLEMMEVAWAELFPPYLPLKTGGGLAFWKRELRFTDLMGALPTPSAPVRRDYWRVLDHLLFDDLATDQGMSDQRLREIQKTSRFGFINRFSEKTLLTGILKLIRGIEAVSPKQGIRGLIQVIERARGLWSFPLAPSLKQRLLDSLRHADQVVAGRSHLPEDEARKLLEDAPTELGLRRKLASFVLDEVPNTLADQSTGTMEVTASGVEDPGPTLIREVDVPIDAADHDTLTEVRQPKEAPIGLTRGQRTPTSKKGAPVDLDPMEALDLVGREIDGKFYIGDKLGGDGAMSTFYRATQLSTGRTVAFKVLHTRDMSLVSRFTREAQILASLDHPNTVRVIDYGTIDEDKGLYFLAMEYVKGPTLLQVMRNSVQPPHGVSMSALRVIRIVQQILKSLAEAHAVGIVHRDLKPGNIIIQEVHGEEDFVKVIDFGIAMVLEPPPDLPWEDLTRVSQVLGTPKYMSPEQTWSKGKGQKLDGRSDLYSLGILMYEMLSGQHPLPSDSPEEYIVAHRKQEPKTPKVINPDGLSDRQIKLLIELVHCLLKKNPKERVLPRDAETYRDGYTADTLLMRIDDIMSDRI